MPLVLGFVELLGGILVLTKGITGATFAQIVRGQARQAYQQRLANEQTGTAGTSSSASAVGGTPNSAGEVNPVPGATGTRLDQGFDVTGQTFLAPFNGHVVFSSASDKGWAGGGFVAIANALNPKNVVYLAEGLLPTVHKGESVTAGQQIAIPAMNPYNGINGNIEIGPANPSSPGQPLAQAVSNPTAAVESFYHWLLGLGGPRATSTALAGHD